MTWWGDGWPWWTAVPMGLAVRAIGGLLVWAVVMAVRPGGPGRHRADDAPPSAEQRPARRLADGDIDAAEYARRPAALRSGRRAASLP